MNTPATTTTAQGTRLEWERDEHGNLRLVDFHLPKPRKVSAWVRRAQAGTLPPKVLA